jgi:hypothetical protein
MLRQNMMNILLAAVAAGVVLVGYSAFIGNNEDGHTATDHIAEYLNLDVATLEKSDDELGELSVDNPVATTDTESTAPTGDAPATTEPTKPTESAPSATPATPAVAKAESVYTVKEGDTYGCIAEKYYGSFEHWVDVMNSNPVFSEGFGEYELHVGAQLVLPAVTADRLKPASSLCS